MTVEMRTAMTDADTHVDECDDTWSYWPDSQIDLKPVTIEFAPDQEPGWLTVQSSGSRHSRSWFIDGQLVPRRYRNDERTGTTLGTRELHDVQRRITDMDAMG